MKRTPVESSTLKSVGYQADTCSLEVEFHHGAVYVYLDVPSETFAALLTAESKGRFFNGHIRDTYQGVRLRRR